MPFLDILEKWKIILKICEKAPSSVAGNFSPSFSHILKFLRIFVHISGSFEPITLIWVSLERFFLPEVFECDDNRSRTKANTHHSRSELAQDSMG